MNKPYTEKPSTGHCSSYLAIKGKLIQCQNEGVRRTDNGLDSGIHCDSCWESMIAECRSRSW